jgi:hypothetical protein
MLLDSAEDVEGDREGASSVFEGDDRLGAGSDGVEKALDLGLERLFLDDFGLRGDDVGHGECGAGDRRGFDCVVDREYEDVFARVIDRNVLVWLEEPELANALGAHAAGGEIGDAAGIEFHANVGNVDFVRENGKAHGAYFFDGRVYER